MKAKKRMWVICPAVAVGILLGSLSAARAAKASKRKLGTPVVVQGSDNRYIRGWARSKGPKIHFTDVEGKQSVLSRKDVTVFKLADLEKAFRKKMRDVKNEEDDRTSEYIKLFPDGKSQHLYETVAALADKLIKRNPSNPARQAVQAKAWAQEYLKRLERVGSGPGAFTVGDEDIQKIRFALVPTDQPVRKLRIVFQKGVRNRFLDRMIDEGTFTKGGRRPFYRKPAAEQLMLVKKYAGNTYQRAITIRNDPPIIAGFRKTVVPMLNRSCITAACHGGGKTPLHLRTPIRTPEQVYTTFIIMETYPAKAGWLLDHANPARSLLATYALPADKVPTGLAHPGSVQPAVRSANQARYKALLAWLESLPAEEMDYGITLPTWPVAPSPTTKPAPRKAPVRTK